MKVFSSEFEQCGEREWGGRRDKLIFEHFQTPLSPPSPAALHRVWCVRPGQVLTQARTFPSISYSLLTLGTLLQLSGAAMGLTDSSRVRQSRRLSAARSFKIAGSSRQCLRTCRKEATDVWIEELTGDISGGGGNFDCIGQPVLSRRCFDAVCPHFGLVITISFNRVFGNLPSSRFRTRGFDEKLLRH